MATVPSVFGSWEVTADGTSFASSGLAYTPSTTTLELVLTVVVDNSAGSPAQTLSGCGMTWGAAGSILGAGSRHRMRGFRQTAGTPSSGDLTISTGATTCERGAGVVITITESDAVAPVQTVTNSGTSTSPSVTLAAVADAANLCLVAFAVRNAASNWTVGSGLTTLHNVSIEADTRFVVAYGYNDTVLDGTWASSGQWVGIGYEIDNVPAAAGSVPAIVASYRRRRAS